MKPILLVSAIGTALLLALLGIYRVSQTRFESRDSESQHSNLSKDSTSIPSTAAPPQHLASMSDIAAIARPPVFMSEGEGVSSEMLLDMDPSFVALTFEEQEWLRQHGFPTKRQVEGILAEDPARLRDLFRSQHLTGMGLYGLYLERNNQIDKAKIVYEAALRNGSIYAARQLGELAAAGINEASHNDSAAVQYLTYMQTARYLGDHRAYRSIDNVLPRDAVTALSYAVLQNFNLVIDSMAEDAKLRGRPPISPAPRPNSSLWARIDSGHAPSTIYIVRQ